MKESKKNNEILVFGIIIGAIPSLFLLKFITCIIQSETTFHSIFYSMLSAAMVALILFIIQGTRKLYNDSDETKMTEKTKASITKIKFSGSTLGGVPLLDIEVEANNQKILFFDVDSELQFHLKIGDNVIISHKKNDIFTSKIDINESIKINSEK